MLYSLQTSGAKLNRLKKRYADHISFLYHLSYEAMDFHLEKKKKFCLFEFLCNNVLLSLHCIVIIKFNLCRSYSDTFSFASFVVAIHFFVAFCISNFIPVVFLFSSDLF